jgi:hypothetical protein
MRRKVFGIGAHRTGTTSLMAALGIIGYRTSHWHDRDRIYADINSGRYRLSLMECVDAVGDLPIPYLYRQLDRAFTDARFILTLREADDWLASVELHTRGRVLEREEQVFYGRDRFDPDAFMAIFERHNSEAIAYFDGRDDFLVIDIVAGDGWEPLCAFLGEVTPDPSTPFPHKSLLR